MNDMTVCMTGLNTAFFQSMMHFMKPPAKYSLTESVRWIVISENI